MAPELPAVPVFCSTVLADRSLLILAALGVGESRREGARGASVPATLHPAEADITNRAQVGSPVASPASGHRQPLHICQEEEARS